MKKGIGIIGAPLMIIGLSIQLWYTYFRGDISLPYIRFAGLGIELLGFLILTVYVLSLMRESKRIGIVGAIFIVTGTVMQEYGMYGIFFRGNPMPVFLFIGGMGMMFLGFFILVGYILSLMRKGNEIGIIGALMTTVGVAMRHFIKRTAWGTDNPALEFALMGIEALGVIVITAWVAQKR